MSRVKIEVARTDHQVRRIRRLKQNRTAVVDNSIRFPQEQQQVLKAKMLNYMERANQSVRLIRLLAKVLHCIGGEYVESGFLSSGYEVLVEIETFRRNTVLAEQLEPFRSAAPHVQHLLLHPVGKRFDERQIHALPRLDQLTTAPKAILKGSIKIVRYHMQRCASLYVSYSRRSVQARSTRTPQTSSSTCSAPETPRRNLATHNSSPRANPRHAAPVRSNSCLRRGSPET